MNNLQLYLFYDLNSNPGKDLSERIQQLWFSTYPNLVGVFTCPIQNVNDCPINPQQANVSVFPTLLFLHQKQNNQAQEVFRMTGHPSTESIKQKLDELASSDLTQNDPGDPGTGTGTHGGSFFPGFGLFNLGIDLPPFLWWVLAGYSAWQSSRSNTKSGKYGFGALGAIAAANAINKKK